MDNIDNAELATYRKRLLNIAYRMLGSVTDAEDVVQDALLRLHSADTKELRSTEAWLVTAVTRLCIDRLRRRRRERLAYPGEWLPEPVAATIIGQPQDYAQQRNDLSIAFLLLLERLKAEERAALILREAFQYSYDEIARMLGKRADACRQMVHRAKKAVQSATAAAPPPEHERRRIVAAFLRALEQGDEAGVLRLISQDAVWRADGGGKAPATAVVLRGKDDLAKLAIGFARKARGVVDFRIVDLAGEPALAWIHEQNLIAVWTMECGADGIVAFNNITNPDKLRHTLT